MEHEVNTREAGPNAMSLRKFVLPEFIFGPGARKPAGRYARNVGARRVLVVTDPGVIAARWTEDVTQSLEASDLACIVYDRVSPNTRRPTLRDVEVIYEEAL